MIRKYLFYLILLMTGMATLPVKAFAHAEKIYYLHGKVKNRAIAVKMLCFDEMPTRQLFYYFQDEKKDHYLHGKLMAERWTFVPDTSEHSSNDIRIVLSISNKDKTTWSGFWIDSAGRREALILEPIQPDSIRSSYASLPFFQELDPYEKYRLSDIRFTKTKSEKITKNLFVDWYVEQQSGIEFFRLLSNNAHANMDSVNTMLETIHLSLLQKKFGYAPDHKRATIETKILYVTDQLVSFQLFSNVTYTTNKTLQSRQLTTLNVPSGLQVDLEDILWFGDSADKPSEGDLYKIYKYRKRVFAPKIFAILQGLYPEKMASSDCGINNVENWSIVMWGLTKKGIAFGLGKTDTCNVESWAIVPYMKLKDFIDERYRFLKK